MLHSQFAKKEDTQNRRVPDLTVRRPNSASHLLLHKTITITAVRDLFLKKEKEFAFLKKNFSLRCHPGFDVSL